MSVESTFFVVCDHCGMDVGNGSDTERCALDDAAAEGWMHTDIDLCPDCWQDMGDEQGGAPSLVVVPAE